MDNVNAEKPVAPSKNGFSEIKVIVIAGLVIGVALIGVMQWYSATWEGPLSLDVIRSASPCVQEHLRSALDGQSEPVTRADLSAAVKACEASDAADAQRAALKN